MNLTDSAALRLHTIFISIGCILASQAEGFAHACGPAEITVPVGEAKLWRITADRTETTTTYIPVLHPLTEGGPIVAQVTPNFVHASKHGDFIIRGLAVGTNALVVQWVYAPTGAASACGVTIKVVAPQAGQTTAQTPRGDGVLTTGRDGVFISSSTFRSIIDANIPGETKKLIVMTQCYAGNVANSSFFRNMPNTCVLSGNSPNQLGHYGGYHDDAARTLGPGEGKTAATVHQAGISGRFSVPPPPAGEGPDDDDTIFGFSEFPMNSGSIAPGDFSLEPVTAEGNVRSRHIVVYAGRPTVAEEGIETHNGHTVPIHRAPKVTVSDAIDRENIKRNFGGQPNTTVTTAGGAGTDGWDFPGSAGGLTAAIRKAGEEIKKSPRPDLEQFILFIGDHGEQGDTAVVQEQNRMIPANSRSSLVSGFRSFPAGSVEVQHMEQDTGNTPRFGLFLPASGQERRQGAGLFTESEIELEITGADRQIVRLNQFEQTSVDFNGDAIVGNFPGEGTALSFPVMEHLLFNFLLDGPLDVQLINRSSQDVVVESVQLLTGLIERERGAIPRPKITSLKLDTEGEPELTVRGWPGETYIIKTSDLMGSWTEAGRIRIPINAREGQIRPTIIPGMPAVLYRAELLE